MLPAGWKDVLRPIRDGLRDRFPSPQPPKDVEKRRRQQEADALKGFAYFEDFDELEHWKGEDVDPLQRSNTPLLPRPTSAQQSQEAGPKAKVLLCHDFGGNYHDYESAQGIDVDQESYSCEDLQFVDTFVYFSHKLACIPPPTWINHLHRNGVKVLGTFLIEPQTTGIERILGSKSIVTDVESAGEFIIAKQLSDMARSYGFDGWLINIEKAFPNKYWDIYQLLRFLEQVKKGLGEHGYILWYDALTVDNKVDYQNGLTHKNLAFARAADAILTNYKWEGQDALDSMKLASLNQISSVDIYFGIDVWAQNAHQGSHPRVTFPTRGGGGTNTGFAVSHLAGLGLSAGIFAPAWPFEHFRTQAKAVDRAMWVGDKLPDHLDCDCGTRSPHHTSLYRRYPICAYAQEYPAGSGTFFYTDFSRSFAPQMQPSDSVDGGKTLRAQLGAYSVLPRLKPLQNARIGLPGDHPFPERLYGELKSDPNRLQLYLNKQPVNGIDGAVVGDMFSGLSLYKLDMPCDGSLQANISLRRLWKRADLDIGFYLLDSCGSITYHRITGTGIGSQSFSFSIQNDSRRLSSSSKARVRELGLYIRGSFDDPYLPAPLLEVMEIAVVPPRGTQIVRGIRGVRLEQRGQDKKHYRVIWDLHNEKSVRAMEAAETVDRPYSSLTGSFAYFLIEADGLCIGRAYAMEFVVSNDLADKLRSDEGVLVRITGVEFDGTRCPSIATRLKDIQSDWCFV